MFVLGALFPDFGAAFVSERVLFAYFGMPFGIADKYIRTVANKQYVCSLLEEKRKNYSLLTELLTNYVSPRTTG